MAEHGCGGGSCGCGRSVPLHEALLDADAPDTDAATVNGVPLHGVGEAPDLETLRQRAYSELLRQAAQNAGLLSAGDAPAVDGVLSAAATAAIEKLLELELRVPDPDAVARRRYYDAHPARFAVGEQVLARHVLFAVTPGVDVDALRRRAEGLLVSLRCADDLAFAQAATDNSNCPSGAGGGELGWLTREDCAPEFAAALFAQDEVAAHIGVLPRLVSTRHGFHIVRVEARQPGELQSFESVESGIAQLLRQQAYVTALRQYLDLLAGRAEIVGLELAGADSPLVQ